MYIRRTVIQDVVSRILRYVRKHFTVADGTDERKEKKKIRAFFTRLIKYAPEILNSRVRRRSRTLDLLVIAFLLTPTKSATLPPQIDRTVNED